MRASERFGAGFEKEVSTAGWHLVSSLLHEALERPPGERHDLVARRCGGDEALRQEVASLLDADPVLVESLDDPIVDLLATPPGLDGSSIGAYRIVRRLGSGGGGVVYLAERADAEIRKQVAIKVSKSGLESEGALRRFQAERQILASLSHPNIAEIWEGGTTSDHRPYFVMELVDGEPIDAYCRHRELSVRKRLEIFLKVCAAVKTVHDHLIIHRDLKPGNILVSAEGEPKLLDFGIAKLLEPAAWQAVTQTTTDVQPMTPQYASPEQIQGGAVTTATDVYGLGLVLFEILAEARPFELAGTSLDEAREMICHHEPKRPSSALAAALGSSRSGRLSSHSRARELAGDLDCIVLKALRKEPDQRYSTVERLAADLRRYLDGQPVDARRGSLIYRLGKLLRRRARAFVIGGVLMMLLSVFLHDHERQSRKTKRAHERVEAAAIYLAEMFLISRDAAKEARAVVPKELLDRGIVMLTDLDEQPELRIELMTAVGLGYLSLGLMAEAAPLMEGALEMSRAIHGDHSEKVTERLNDLAWLRVEQGRFQDAEAIYRRMLRREILRRGEHDPEIAVVRNELAATILDQGRYEEAALLFQQALEVKRLELGDADPQVAAIAGNLAVTFLYRGRYDEAAARFRDLLGSLRQRLPDNDNQVACTKVNLASALRSMGQFEAADELFQEVLSLHRSRPPTFGLGMTLEHLAMSLLMQGELDEARRLAEEAATLFRRLAGVEHPHTARAETLLARVLLEQGLSEPAEKLLRQAASTYSRGQSPVHWRRAETTNLLGAALLARGELSEAEDLIRSSHREIRSLVGDQALPVQEAALRLAALEARLADPQAAHR